MVNKLATAFFNTEPCFQKGFKYFLTMGETMKIRIEI